MEHKPTWMQDERMKQYFDNLPASVQENIMQSSVPMSSYEELVRCAENIREKKHSWESNTSTDASDNRQGEKYSVDDLML